MKIAVFWGGAHTLPGACDDNTWYSFYNSGWKYGFEQLGHQIDYFAWEDIADHPGYDLYLYAPGFLTTATFHKNLHHPNLFFTEEASLGISWAINHSFHYDGVCFLDYLNWKAMKANGVKNAYWVPGAVDPTIFHPTNCQKRHLVTFLGNYDHTVIIEKSHTRVDYIRAIDTLPGALVARGYYSMEANRVWNETYVGIDVPIVEFCSFRLFQIIAAGALCLTRKTRVESGISHLLPTDLYETYTDLDDLISRWRYVDKNVGLMFADKIQKAQEHVMKHNTFKQRAQQLLQIAKLESRQEELFKIEENYYGRY